MNEKGPKYRIFNVIIYISALVVSISSMYMYIEIAIFSTQQYILYGSGLVFSTHKRWLNWGELAKTVIMCHNRCCTLKIPPWSNAVGAKHMSKTYSPLPRFHMTEIFYSVTLNNIHTNRQNRKNTTKAFSTGHIQCQIHFYDF